MASKRQLPRRALLTGGLGLAAAYTVGCGGGGDNKDGDGSAANGTGGPTGRAGTGGPTGRADTGGPTPTPSSSGGVAQATDAADAEDLPPGQTPAPGGRTPRPTRTPQPLNLKARWGRLPVSGPQPPGRRDHSLVTDGKKLYLFGGRDPSPLGDTWVFDPASAQWTEVATAGPDARFGHNAGYNSLRDRIVMFGGQAAGFFNDVWAFQIAPRTWEKIEAGPGPGPPSPRYGAAAAIDSGSHRFLISHGFTNSGRFDDTWALVLGGDVWFDAAVPQGRPLARCLTRGAWDRENDRFLMFGGQSNPTPFLGDFWSYTPGVWTELSGGPPARNLYAMDYDRDRGLVVLIGGAGENGNLNDVWIFDVVSDAWRQMSPSGEAPSARASHDAVYVRERKSIIVFGGFDGSYLNDLWELKIS